VRPFGGRRIVLGITGGIASYKIGWLARLLSQAGAEVDVVMTRGATEFVAPVTFEALTGRPVHSDIFAAGRALDHIRLAKEAEAVVVAPCTADFLARAVHGRADDLLAAVLLATRAPVLLVPAMNDNMWSHAATVRNAAAARELGYTVLDPDTGPLAEGDATGPGRMPEPETIFEHAGRLLEKRSLAGKKLLVTAGPTREPVDAVRFLSNHSSGKMGVAIAAAAWRRGAEVTLVAGPLEVAPPAGVRVLHVERTEEMARAVGGELPRADALIMAAAPADFRAAAPVDFKIKKKSAPDSVALAPTVDILAETRAKRKKGAVIVGFALETDDVAANAKAKLEAKGLDLIVVNDAKEPGAGFAVDTNRVTLIGKDGRSEPLALMAKTELADILLDRVEALLGAR
jgi:phosphopantothenoylcysteine decarboxylase/phosphopantothenate--cysteine ligase